MTIAYLSVVVREEGRFYLNAAAFGFSQERIAQLFSGKDEQGLVEVNAALRAAAFRLEQAEPLSRA